MAEEFTKWDATEHLRSVERACGLLEACLEESPGDGGLIRAALGKIAQAKEKGRLDLEFEPGEEGLLQALAETGNLSYATVQELARLLGLQLRITA